MKVFREPSGNAGKNFAIADVPEQRVPEESNRSRGREGREARFPRSARLLRHADFDRVYKSGKRHFSASMTVFYLARASAEKACGLRVGFTVGKVLGGAVVRNRMKRRLREAVRLTRPPGDASPNVDVVINPKKSLLGAEFEAIVNEVRRAFVVIEKASREPRATSPDRDASSARKK